MLIVPKRIFAEKFLIRSSIRKKNGKWRGWEPLAVFAQLANIQAQHRTYINEDKENLKREVASGKKPITALSAADLATPLKKPIIFLNINHYFDHLRYFIDEMRRQKILSEEETSFIGFAEKPKDVLPLAQKLAK